MARSRWILPRADAACGKAFYADRKSAECHRIALDFWRQATGRTRQGYRLTAYRCRRCGGFHLANKKIQDEPMQLDPHLQAHKPVTYWEEAALDSVDESINLSLISSIDGF